MPGLLSFNCTSKLGKPCNHLSTNPCTTSCLLWKNISESMQFKILYLILLHVYACQLFLRYRREIFILGVLGFLKPTRSFLKIPEEVQSLPNKSEVFRRRLKSSENVRSFRTRINGSSLPVLFTFKNQRSRGRYCHLFILHMVFVPYVGLS